MMSKTADRFCALAVTTTLQFMREGELGPLVAFCILALGVLVVGAIIFVERGQRRIPVQYAKRVVGRKMYGGMTSRLPLKINTANVIPPIFASSILIFPATLAQFAQTIPWVQTAARRVGVGSWLHNLVYIFYPDHLFRFLLYCGGFNPSDVTENMKKAAVIFRAFVRAEDRRVLSSAGVVAHHVERRDLSVHRVIAADYFGPAI